MRGGSTEGGLTFVQQEDAGIRKGKQESIFSRNTIWSLDKCGEEVFLGRMPGLELSNQGRLSGGGEQGVEDGQGAG